MCTAAAARTAHVDTVCLVVLCVTWLAEGVTCLIITVCVVSQMNETYRLSIGRIL